MKVFIFLVPFLFSSLLIEEVNGVEDNAYIKPMKLFLFGDSYVDTGNIKSPNYVSRKFPYGITFPGKPSGRFSDGRVATDYLAQMMAILSPIPYEWRDPAGKERLRYGMNFAYGGTGVFNTLVSLPNMTTQIDFFQKVLTTGNIYSSSHLNSSVGLVSIAGNDYATFIAHNHSFTELPTFIKQVVDQIEVNLRRIHALGVKKIGVASLQPLGCLPWFTTISSFQRCNDSINTFFNQHNNLLQQVVAKLNNDTEQVTFVFLDYYNAFLSVFKNKGANLGSTRFETPLKPCCEGAFAYEEKKGVKKYTLCDDPKSAFFWDALHPSQEGWSSVYSVLSKHLTESLIKV